MQNFLIKTLLLPVSSFLLCRSYSMFETSNNNPINSLLQNLVPNNNSNHKWYVLEAGQNTSFHPATLNSYNFKDKKIALLVVGLFSDQSSLTSLGRFLLKKDKYDYVFCFSYNLLEKNIIPNLINQMNEGIKTIVGNNEKPKQLDLFSHSFGGLLTKYLLRNLSPEDSQNLSGTCKNAFFFGTPHQGIQSTDFKNIADNLYNKLTQQPTIGMMATLLGLSSNLILDATQGIEVYHHLVGNTELLSTAKPLPSSINYYNIVGTNSNLSLPSMNLMGIQFSANNFIHEGYQKTDPDVVTDGVVKKQDANLIPFGLDPSHELEVNYNHNALVGINNREQPNKVPKPIRQWIKSISVNNFPIKVNLVDEGTQQVKEGVLISPNAVLFISDKDFQPNKTSEEENIIESVQRFEDTNLYIAFSKNPFLNGQYTDINPFPTQGKILGIPVAEIDLNQEYLMLKNNGSISNSLIFSQPQNRLVGWSTDNIDDEIIIATVSPSCRQWINSMVLENACK